MTFTGLSASAAACFRGLVRSPGFALGGALTLALGLAGAAVPFAAVNGVLLRPLPYKDANRLAEVMGAIQPADFRDLMAMAEPSVFARMALYLSGNARMGSAGRSRQIATMSVSRGFFAIAGLSPTLGRLFSSNEYSPGRNSVAVISHRLWVRRFGSSPGALGKTVVLNAEPYTVVGVAPAGTNWKTEWVYPAVQVWLPLALTPQESQARGTFVPTFTGKPTGLLGTGALVRLHRGMDLRRARAGLAAALRTLASRHPEDKGLRRTLRLYPLRQLRTLLARRTLLPLFGASVLLLVIACANFAGLMLIRGLGRAREMAVRVTLGARRGDLLTRAVLDGLVLALPSAALAAWFTVVGVDYLRTEMPHGMLPRIDQVSTDWTSLCFIAVAALLAGAIAGALPVIVLPYAEPAAVLSRQSQERSSALHSGRPLPFGRALVAAQSALATVLLVGAALMGRSVWMLTKVRTGFAPKGIVQAYVARPSGALNQPAAWSPHKDAELWGQVIDRLNAVPGVTSAALADPGTYGSNTDCFFSVPSLPGAGTSRLAVAQYLNVSPGYFQTLRIPVLSGRAFRNTDSLKSPRVAIVNRSLERLYFGSATALGRDLYFADGPEAHRHRLNIVGVVPDIDIAGAEPGTHLQIYTPLLQVPTPVAGLLARVDGQYANTVPALRAAVSNVSARLVLKGVAPLPEVISRTLFARPRFLLILLSVFGALALLLAFAGVYAVASLAARHKVRETAIRLALGAPRRNLLASVLREAAWTGLLGAAGGILVSLSLAGFIRAWLFGVPPNDTFTLATAGGAVLAANLLAGCIPAATLLRVRPAEALRAE